MSIRPLVVLAGLWFSIPAFAGAVTFTTTDGVTVHGTDYGKGTKGVVLVHDRGHSATDWAYFGEKLGGLGYHVLAIDLRGHGASKPPETLVDDDYKKMTADVAGGVAWLRGKGATEIQLVGANLGANLAITAASEDPKIKSVALLSPGLNIAGVTLAASVFEKLGDKPVLLMVSAETSYEVRTVTYIEEKALGPHPLELLENAGSGVKMLNRVPDAETKLIAWLNGTYGPAGQKVGPTKEIKTGDTSAEGMKTSGKKFGQ